MNLVGLFRGEEFPYNIECFLLNSNKASNNIAAEDILIFYFYLSKKIVFAFKKRSLALNRLKAD